MLIHGFPQTHAMWHRLAPELARHFTLVIPDLRGYGFSSCPANDSGNRAYSKRAMGEDLFEVMTALGFPRFGVAGHDRGGRVAYRMALDSPQRISALMVLDIIPTFDMWQSLDAAFAMKTYHWLFLAQPHPLPEMLIEQAPIAFLDYTLASWTKSGNLAAFHDDGACGIPASLCNSRACARHLQRLSRRMDVRLQSRRGRPKDRKTDISAQPCRYGAMRAFRGRSRARSNHGKHGAPMCAATASTAGISLPRKIRKPRSAC